ncbi:MAG: hypothetical protein VX796_05950 [Pseudomonadota bacterium]|nr:hypothetical protein [Pseudomonadota bacterium]
MQITEDMVTPHHLAAAERWIAANGMPATDAELSRMGREVAQEAHRVVEHMAEKTFEALTEHHEDGKANVETFMGARGREFMEDVYHELKRRA